VAASGRTVEAIDLYRRAIGARPWAAEARFNLALLLCSQGKRAEGKAEMRKALTLNPKLKDPAVKNSISKPSSTPTSTPTPTSTATG
jgi:tetratricopeptide (TPR) repeat protein